MKYQWFTPSGCKDIGIRKINFAAETQFLCWSTGAEFNLVDNSPMFMNDISYLPNLEE